MSIVEQLLGIADLKTLEIDFEGLVFSADVLAPLLRLIPSVGVSRTSPRTAAR